MFEKLKEIENTILELNEDEKMDYFLEFSNEKNDFMKNQMIKKNLVIGCVSEVFIYIEIDKNKKIKVYGFTKSLFVKAYLNIILSCVNNLTKIEFEKFAKKRIEIFLEKTKIQKSLSPTRANTFGNIFNFIETKVGRV
jgi:cysteine desulfuration protein SufE